MTSCELNARRDITDNILGMVKANPDWNAKLTLEGQKLLRIFFTYPNTNRDSYRALVYARSLKKMIEKEYSPKIYKAAAIINTSFSGGIEVSYDIPYDLIRDQVIRNNTPEEEEEEVTMEKVEKKQQEAVNDVIFEFREDYINDEGDVGYVIYRVEDGIVQISKLTRIQDFDDLKKQQYRKNEQNYKYSEDLSIEQQEKVVDQLTGMLMDIISDDLLNNRKSEVFYKETIKSADGTETSRNFLNIKKSITRKLKILTPKIQQNKATEAEIEEYNFLSIIWNPVVFQRIQNDIIDRLKSRGYKFKDGKIKQSQDDENIQDIQDVLGDMENVEFETFEGYTGKSDQLSEYSAITVSNKERMSSELRTFLSSIKSNEPALFSLTYGEKKYDTQYINENMVIQAINEVTIGLNTFDKMVASLEEASKSIKNREFLSQVANKLREEKAKGTKIANQFVDKFNQQKNDLVIAQFERKQTIDYTYIDRNGKKIYVPLRDSDNNIIYYYDYKVINANRNDIFINLKNEAKQRFIEKNELDGEVVPKEKLENAKEAYKKFKEYIRNNYSLENKFKNNEEAIQQLKNLFDTLDFDFSDELYEEMVTSKRGIFQLSYNINKKGNSVFNNKYGILETIFSNTEEDTTLDAIFGSSGALTLFRFEASLKNYYYNTSTLDGKGRNIWGYGMPSPMFRELNDILTDDNLVELNADEERSLFTSSSYIIQQLNQITSTDERKLFKEKIKYNLFNTLKQARQ